MNRMKSLIWAIIPLLVVGCNTKSESQTGNETAQLDTVVISTGLEVPWEILWGPDDHIWVTERPGRVLRINPTSRLKQVILEVNVATQGESGLLGMALHPDFPAQPQVYIVYNYTDGDDIKERLVRYTYEQEQLVNPEILIDDITGNTYHDGSRLLFGPDGKLYMTTGDAGNMPLSQNPASLNGKILRINPDGSIPEDNPVAGSYVWASGLRNTQGLDFSSTGTLYSSEHGPESDDEINILTASSNYGWPEVKGPCNTNAEIDFCNANNVVEPIQTYTPTLALAGIAYYGHTAIPEWTNSLIVTSLKAGQLLILHLDEAGASITGTTRVYNDELGRLRDVCVSPEGRVFISTSNRDGRGSPKQGDDKIIEITVADPTSTGEKDKSSGFNIYPNPTKGSVKASIDSKFAKGTFELYDMVGNFQMGGQCNSLVSGLDVSELPTGVYSIVVKSNDDYLARTFLLL